MATSNVIPFPNEHTRKEALRQAISAKIIPFRIAVDTRRNLTTTPQLCAPDDLVERIFASVNRAVDPECKPAPEFEDQDPHLMGLVAAIAERVRANRPNA